MEDFKKISQISIDSTNLFTTSTFSGWGQYIGFVSSDDPINKIKTCLVPFDAANPVTKIRARIRQMPDNQSTWGTTNPYMWTILADIVIEKSLIANAANYLTFCFGDDIRLSGHLWFEFLTDGRCGVRGAAPSLYTIPEPPKSHWITIMSINYGNWTPSNPHCNFYAELGIGKYDIEWQLPANIYAVEGCELNAYYTNCFRGNYKTDELGITVKTNKGEQNAKFWRYNPVASDAGQTPFQIVIRSYDNQKVLSSKTVNLITKPANHPATPVSRKLLVISDSTIADGLTLAELKNLFSNDFNYNLNLVGSNTGTVNDSLGYPRAIACDAIAGWSLERFYGDNVSNWVQIDGTPRTGSPFIFHNSFNFSTYLSVNSISMAEKDWVIIDLGINDIANCFGDSNIEKQICRITDYLDLMIASIKSVVAGIRIGICLMLPPAASQNAFGYSYKTYIARSWYCHCRNRVIETVIDKYEEKLDNVFIVPFGLGVDPENDFPIGLLSLGKRNNCNINTQNNAFHPAPSGKYKMADMLRMFLKCQE